MRALRVLHLGANPASQLDVTVRALRAVGVDAHGLALGPNPYSSERSIRLLPAVRRRPMSVVDQLRRIVTVLPAIARSDVVHWHSVSVLTRSLDLRSAKALGKRRLVEFWGSDIRVDSIESADNPAYAAALAAHPSLHRLDRDRSFAHQRTFARAGCDCVLADPGMRPSLDAAAFRRVYAVRQRVEVERYVPVPSRETARPVVVHAPSRRELKGTSAVERVVESLRERVDFEFHLVEGLSRQQALAAIRSADVFVDELVVGAYGMAALEAMAYARPVVSYLKPSVRALYPAELPIVPATEADLGEVLSDLLASATRRHDLGLAGRAYVERHHDARKLALELVEAYRER